MTIDALDGSEAMLKKAEQKGVYRKLFCDRLGPNRLSIDDSKSAFLHKLRRFGCQVNMAVIVPNLLIWYKCGLSEWSILSIWYPDVRLLSSNANSDFQTSGLV